MLSPRPSGRTRTRSSDFFVDCARREKRRIGPMAVGNGSHDCRMRCGLLRGQDGKRVTLGPDDGDGRVHAVPLVEVMVSEPMPVSINMTAAQLVADPAGVVDVDVASLPTLLAQLTTAAAVVAARLSTIEPPSAPQAAAGSGRRPTANEAAGEVN